MKFWPFGKKKNPPIEFHKRDVGDAQLVINSGAKNVEIVGCSFNEVPDFYYKTHDNPGWRPIIESGYWVELTKILVNSDGKIFAQPNDTLYHLFNPRYSLNYGGWYPSEGWIEVEDDCWVKVSVECFKVVERPKESKK